MFVDLTLALIPLLSSVTLFPLLSSLSTEMDTLLLSIPQIFIVLYPSFLELFPDANFHLQSLFLFGVLETFMCKWKITVLGNEKLEFEFAYDIRWTFNSGQII